MEPPVFPIKVFYDGSCYVCASEMNFYRENAPEGRLDFVDITAEGFEPGRYGLTQEDFMRQIHAMDKEGRMFEGVDAFWAIGKAFPAYSFYGILGALAMNPLFNPLARLLYWSFARFRKHLPKKKRP